MTFDSNKHRRRTIRLSEYDYASAGGYFITTCTHDRACLFGEVVDYEMHLNSYGEIAREEWYQTAVLRPYMMLDAFVVMPNHVHGIIGIIDDDHVGARPPCPRPRRIRQTTSPRPIQHCWRLQICRDQTH